MAVERPDGDIRPVLNLSAPKCKCEGECRHQSRAIRVQGHKAWRLQGWTVPYCIPEQFPIKMGSIASKKF